MSFEYCRQGTIARHERTSCFQPGSRCVKWLLILCPIFGFIIGTEARAQEKPFQVGIASVYWDGSRDARGRRFDKDGPTMAHRSLPFGTIVQVRILGTKRRCWAIVTDRGPFVKRRIVDLTLGSARRIGMGRGLARVRLDIVADGRGKPLYPMFAREALAGLERISSYRRVILAESP